jgi:hypothetical protein
VEVELKQVSGLSTLRAGTCRVKLYCQRKLKALEAKQANGKGK